MQEITGKKLTDNQLEQLEIINNYARMWESEHADKFAKKMNLSERMKDLVQSIFFGIWSFDFYNEKILCVGFDNRQKYTTKSRTVEALQNKGVIKIVKYNQHSFDVSVNFDLIKSVLGADIIIPLDLKRDL